MPISGGLSGIWDYAKGLFGNEPQQVPNQPGTDQVPQETQSIEALFGGDPNTVNNQAASPIGMPKEDLEKMGMTESKDGNFYLSGNSSSSEMMYKLDPKTGQYVFAPNYGSKGGLMDFTPMVGGGSTTLAKAGLSLLPTSPLNAVLNSAGDTDGTPALEQPKLEMRNTTPEEIYAEAPEAKKIAEEPENRWWEKSGNQNYNPYNVLRSRNNYI